MKSRFNWVIGFALLMGASGTVIFSSCGEPGACPVVDGGTAGGAGVGGGVGGGGGGGGATGGSGGGMVSMTPSLSILYPEQGATITPHWDATRPIEVAVDVHNFTLKALGTCAGAANCGHIEIRIDGNECNRGIQADGGVPGYNNAGVTRVLLAEMLTCIPVQGFARQNGAHTITAALHGDDGMAITGLSATVDITTAGIYTDPTVKIHAENLTFGPTSFPMKIAVLEGALGLPGPYVVRLNFPPFTVFPLHSHTGSEQVTVLDGTWHLSLDNTTVPNGAPLDQTKFVTYHKGGYTNTPAGHNMFIIFGPRGASVQVHGIGPWAIRTPALAAWKAADGGWLTIDPNDPIFGYCNNLDGGPGADGGC